MEPKTAFGVSVLVALLLVISCDGFLGKSGKFYNCGTVPFNLSWSPEPISPSQLIKFSVDFTAPHDITGGTYNITIWFHEDPDPFLEFSDSFSCDTISKYIPCPLKKGFHIHDDRIVEHIPNIGSYPGDYDIRIEIKNTQKQEIICLKGHVIILKS